jgi:hypothetical protein
MIREAVAAYTFSAARFICAVAFIKIFLFFAFHCFLPLQTHFIIFSALPFLSPCHYPARLGNPVCLFSGFPLGGGNDTVYFFHLDGWETPSPIEQIILSLKILNVIR